MTLEMLFQKYLDLLWVAFLFDYEVFSKPWLYAWLIPACFYLMFFFIKWTILTFPVWGPVGFIVTIPFKIIYQLKRK